MLPEFIKSFSIKRHWHVIVLLLASLFAVSSETSNFIIQNNAFVLVGDLDKKTKETHYSLDMIPVNEFDKSKSSAETYVRVDNYLRWVIFILLLVCAFRYLSVAVRQHDLLAIYQKMFVSKGSNPDQEIDKILEYISENIFKLNGADRVSIYKYNLSMDCFFRVGRFSADPIYRGGGRREYPNKASVILNAWEAPAGYFQHDRIPDFFKVKSNNGNHKKLKTYFENNSLGDFSVSKIRDMRMRSRCYHAAVITDPESSKKSAVIVFESTQPSRFKKRHVENLLSSEYGEIIRYLVYRRSVQLVQSLEPENES